MISPQKTNPRRAEICYINPRQLFIAISNNRKKGANPDIKRMRNPMHDSFHHHPFTYDNLCKIARIKRIPKVSSSDQTFPAATTIMK